MHFYDSHHFVLTFQLLLGTSFVVYINGDHVAITQFSIMVATIYHGLYFIATYVSFATGSAGESNNAMIERYPLAGMIAQLLYTIQILGFVAIVFLTWWKRNKDLHFYQKLYDFDTMIRKHFRCDFAYGRVQQQSLLGIIVMVGYIVSLCGFMVQWTDFFNTDSLSALLPIFLQMTMLSTNAFSFFYCTYLLKIRFRTIKAIISEHERSVDEIKTLFKFYKQLHSLIGTVNDVHGLKELINILNDFVIITVELFFTFTILINDQEAIRNNWKLVLLGFGWVLPHSAKIFVCCYGSHTALLEVKTSCNVKYKSF
jgi:7tm Chemosensory receptor